ncbi:MAG: rhodanese-like domain-containing protein [Proteobacteria bacterium]|nr:rhodanese-like domain-containing protein [Pseudomonadota bacterium]
MRISLAVCLALAASAVSAYAQIAIPDLGSQQTTYFFEATDRGVAATTSYRRTNYHAATPTALPGARVVRTLELKRLVDAAAPVQVIDVLDSQTRASVPGAAWLPDGGKAYGSGADRAKFDSALAALTKGDKAKTLVFLCSGADCWLSYNASLLAIELGYKDVLWYRGGSNAWQGANLELSKVSAFAP